MKDDGIFPAFPVAADHYSAQEFPRMAGMSLRDWFAGQALTNPELCTGEAPQFKLREWFPGELSIKMEDVAAKQAYEIADAMLKERENGE